MKRERLKMKNLFEGHFTRIVIALMLFVLISCGHNEDPKSDHTSTTDPSTIPDSPYAQGEWIGHTEENYPLRFIVSENEVVEFSITMNGSTATNVLPATIEDGGFFSSGIFSVRGTFQGEEYCFGTWGAEGSTWEAVPATVGGDDEPVEEEDLDFDGYSSTEDCDDTDPVINPGAEEICGDTIDQDCDGSDLSCAPPCEISFDPEMLEIDASGGASYVRVTSTGDCDSCFVFSGNESWISIVPVGGTRPPFSVGFSIDPNTTGSQRQTNVSICSRSYRVVQEP